MPPPNLTTYMEMYVVCTSFWTAADILVEKGNFECRFMRNAKRKDYPFLLSAKILLPYMMKREEIWWLLRTVCLLMIFGFIILCEKPTKTEACMGTSRLGN